MRPKTKNVQKLDVSETPSKMDRLGLPVRVLEIVEEWKGRGWGFRFERKRTETTTTVESGDSHARK